MRRQMARLRHWLVCHVLGLRSPSLSAIGLKSTLRYVWTGNLSDCAPDDKPRKKP